MALREVEYKLYYEDDDPGSIVEALNTDREYAIWEVDTDSGEACIVVIHPEYIKVKIIKDETTEDRIE